MTANPSWCAWPHTEGNEQCESVHYPFDGGVLYLSQDEGEFGEVDGVTRDLPAVVFEGDPTTRTAQGAFVRLTPAAARAYAARLVELADLAESQAQVVPCRQQQHKEE